MQFEWDEAKSKKNVHRRGIDFADAVEMFESPMLVRPDGRRDYGETRYIGFGRIQGRLMAVAFTERDPDIIRIISLRKANKREQANFEKAVRDRLGAH